MTDFELAWKKSASHKDSGLLRLELLRQMSWELHSHKSVLLTERDANEARKLENVESRLILYKELNLGGTPQSLQEIHVFTSAQLKEIPKFDPPLDSQSLKPSLKDLLTLKKLARPDRVFELALCVLADRSEWTLWSCELTLPVSDIEQKQTELRKTLWPNGLVLWVESCGFLDESQWKGQWLVWLAPHVNKTDSNWKRIYPIV